MSRVVRLALACLVLALVSATAASGQTFKLSVVIEGNTPGVVRAVTGAAGACAQAECVFYVDAGATVRLAAVGSQPGRFSQGTGPAKGCGASICSFVMTAAADVIATFTSGDGPIATLTIDSAGDGQGLVVVDGVTCAGAPCAVGYLQGSAAAHIDTGAGAGSLFTGFSGSNAITSACGVASPVCNVTVTGNMSATASFMAITSFTSAPTSATTLVAGPSQPFTVVGTFNGGSLPVTGKGTWTAAPSMPFARQAFGAAALGTRIYVVGGSSSNGLIPYHSVAVFDTVAQTWSSVADYPESVDVLSVAASGGFLYGFGGRFGIAVASVYRYDPVSNAWTPRTAMKAPRYGAAVGVINGIVYVAGGFDKHDAPVATVEAYDPATDTWTTKASLSRPRGVAGGAVVDGIFYLIGGAEPTTFVSTVDAYDPASNTWTAKAPLPAPMDGPAVAVADGVIYVMRGQASRSIVCAYDPVANAWSDKAPMKTGRSYVAAVSVDGVVYALGGATGDDLATASSVVERYIASLRWKSDASSVARVTQTGLASPVSVGTATLTMTVGTQACAGNCPVLNVIVPPPTSLSLDEPTANSVVASGGLRVSGWAINRGAQTTTGVDAVHVYAAPASGAGAVFLGVASYGTARSDIGALYGPQFTNSGFVLQNVSLAPGRYVIVVFAHDTLTGTFDATARANITVSGPVSNPAIAVDTPTAGQTVTSAFEVGGWALDAGAPSGTGVDAITFYVQPVGAPAPGIFIGTGSYGAARGDVAALFGARFTAVGFHFTITGMSPGTFTLNVVAHDTLTNSNSIVKSVPFTVSATALMSIDVPSAEATIAAATFTIGGWSIDRTVEGTTMAGSGVDAVHIYAFPNPGSGEAPIFLGVAMLGASRPDVGALYGSRYGLSGYNLTVNRGALGLGPGVYSIGVVSHSAVSGAFNNTAVVRVTLQ